jgi:hypothetical protein
LDKVNTDIKKEILGVKKILYSLSKVAILVAMHLMHPVFFMLTYTVCTEHHRQMLSSLRWCLETYMRGRWCMTWVMRLWVCSDQVLSMNYSYLSAKFDVRVFLVN